MTRRSGLAILLSCALLTPLVFVPRSHAETGNGKATNAVWPTSGTTAVPVQQSSTEISPSVLRALGITPQPAVDPQEAQRQIAQQITGNTTTNISPLPAAESGTLFHEVKPATASERASSAAQHDQSGRLTPAPEIISASGLPEVLAPNSALSTALITSIGGVNTPLSQVDLLADWDGKEDMTADRSATLVEYVPSPSPTPSPVPPTFAVTRTGISEHTFANGHNFNSYYHGDTLGNFYFTFDLVGSPAIDVGFTANLPAILNTPGGSAGFFIGNPTPGDCMDPTAVVTGTAVNPVADLGDFDPALCGVTGEVVYVSTLETVGCAANGSAQKIRSRIFAFSIFEIGGTEFVVGKVLQIARTSVENIGGLAVDDDGSLYFSVADLSSVNAATGVGGLGGAIFKATERPRTTCTTAGRINRVITSIPGLDGPTNTTLSQPTPISNASTTLTNYSGTSPVFGNIAAITAGPQNVVYAATAASNTGTSDPTQGLFAAPGAFPGGLPSMIMTFADASGRFDTCTQADPSLPGVLPTSDGFADVSPGTTTTWRAFVLGNGPDIRTSSSPLNLVTGTPQNTLKLSMQIDLTTYSGLAVNEEGTAFVISGGTPSGVGNNPSPSLSEILGFEDRQPADRRADYVDFRGNNPPVPPASGGNVGDGDSDRFDHIYYQATIDGGSSNPFGLSGLARGFLRYTNRLAPVEISPTLTLGKSGGQATLGDDDTTAAPILFENLDPGHQVAGGDDQNSPFTGDDSDSAGDPTIAGARNGGFEFALQSTVSPTGIWNGFFWNSNGNVTFAAGDTDNTPTVLELRAGAPRIAAAWNDLNPSARAATFGTFPVQALGFANVNAFKVRWINVPEFGSETCTATDGGATNKFSITLYDDGTGVDENASQPLNAGNNKGDNGTPFDRLEGPTDLRYVPGPAVGLPPVAEPPRPEGSGQFRFEYGRMDLLGTEDQPVLTGYSVGQLLFTNPPGLCEVNISEVARAADGAFGVLSDSQSATVLPGLIGEGTEPTVFEYFSSGVHGSVSSGGIVTPSLPDFDLRFEGNDPAATKPAAQVDQNRGIVSFFGVTNAPPPSPIIRQVIVTPGAFTPNAGADLLDAIGSVDVVVLGSGFYPNEVTTLCVGAPPPPAPGVPLQRPGKTVSSAMTFLLDNNADGTPEAVVALANVTPISRNMITAKLVPLATAPGTAFPFAIFTGQGTFNLTTTFTFGDNNVFGPFTRTAVKGGIPLGARAPIVLGVSKTNGDCSAAQDVTISGFNFTAGGLVTAVFGVEDGNPANVINASSFTVLNDNQIQASFNFGGVNSGKRFLIFVSGPGGTSRNIFPSLPPGAPAGAPLGNEQGNIISFNCASAVALDTLQFSSANLNVTEDSTTVGVTVSRLNPGPGTVTVDYATADLSATQKGDYEFAAGTLTFAPGETTKVIPILINEDSFLEGTESFVLNLSNPTGGGTAGAPSTITILDDEVSVLSTNVIDNASDFVRQQYHDFLNRDADAPGLAFWTNEITSCAGNAGCIDLKRQNVSAAFFLSIEFQETGGNVLRLQRVAFARKSNEAGTRVPYTQFMRDAQQVGRGVIVGQAGYQTVLEQNKQAYAQQVASSAAFITRFPLALSASAYVDALFASAGIVPTTAERNAAIAAFGAGGLAGRVAALRSVADANSLKAAEFNADFVLMEYYGYLRRNPTDAPDSNDDGYQFWLTKLNSFSGNFVQADMVKSFLVSGEYRHRFGLN